MDWGGLPWPLMGFALNANRRIAEPVPTSVGDWVGRWGAVIATILTPLVGFLFVSYVSLRQEITQLQEHDKQVAVEFKGAIDALTIRVIGDERRIDVHRDEINSIRQEQNQHESEDRKAFNALQPFRGQQYR